MEFKWKILEVASSNGELDHVKYHVTATEGENKVETEGYAYFKLPEDVNFSEITELELVSYVKRLYVQNDVNSIEYRLIEQINELKKVLSKESPWLANTFTI